MSYNLEDLITKTLGVVPTAKAPTKFASCVVPERPAPEYEFRIKVYRQEYGVVFVQAKSADAAFDVVDVEYVHWNDYGDIEWDGAEQSIDHPLNQNALDEWDYLYGSKYHNDGTPKCSGCDESLSEQKLTQSPNDDKEWFCTDCYHQHVIYP